jgi:hypothetical protein
MRNGIGGLSSESRLALTTHTPQVLKSLALFFCVLDYVYLIAGNLPNVMIKFWRSVDVQ